MYRPPPPPVALPLHLHGPPSIGISATASLAHMQPPHARSAEFAEIQATLEYFVEHSALIPRPAAYALRMNILVWLQELCSSVFPETVPVVCSFGSFASGIWTMHSDLDVNIWSRERVVNFFPRLKAALLQLHTPEPTSTIPPALGQGPRSHSLSRSLLAAGVLLELPKRIRLIAARVSVCRFSINGIDLDVVHEAGGIGPGRIDLHAAPDAGEGNNLADSQNLITAVNAALGSAVATPARRPLGALGSAAAFNALPQSAGALSGNQAPEGPPVLSRAPNGDPQDVEFQHSLDITRWTKSWLGRYPFLVSLLRVVKLWASHERINDAHAGTLPSLAFQVMLFSVCETVCQHYGSSTAPGSPVPAPPPPLARPPPPPPPPIKLQPSQSPMPSPLTLLANSAMTAVPPLVLAPSLHLHLAHQPEPQSPAAVISARAAAALASARPGCSPAELPHIGAVVLYEFFARFSSWSDASQAPVRTSDCCSEDNITHFDPHYDPEHLGCGKTAFIQDPFLPKINLGRFLTRDSLQNVRAACGRALSMLEGVASGQHSAIFSLVGEEWR
eukprot:TRINITY_DN2993_c0_g1_i1.p1 TRINITY_DN2993_c0_g1~~TRINITY_DN2993_c0_g1_i1.p1  ORF type:complete len:560 (+),score=78.60 TRINITY_DN2993_c0_g1_i1:283-1962(+)